MVFMAMFSDKFGSWYDTRYFRLTGNNDGNFDHKSEGLSKYLNQNLWFWPKTQGCSNAKVMLPEKKIPQEENMSKE